jgi:hypothetical protein
MNNHTAGLERVKKELRFGALFVALLEIFRVHSGCGALECVARWRASELPRRVRSFLGGEI